MKHVLFIGPLRIPLWSKKIIQDEGSRKDNLTLALRCVHKHNKNWLWKLLRTRRKIDGYKSPWET